jgi:uncharacterized protein
MLAQHELQFNVAQLLKEATGGTRRHDINLEIGDELDEEVSAVAPLAGQIEFLRTGRNILAIGRLETTLQKTCGRCLNEFTMPVSVELAEEFYPSIDIFTGAPLPKTPEVDPENYINDQNMLNLFEVVRQELVVASAALFYCRPDCKGLCPYCGQDRNVVACTCREDQIDPRWAGLQTLETED